MTGAIWLIIGGCLSALASLMHILIILGGPSWYRFFGAGEQMADMAAQGQAYPAIITSGIAAVLAIWSVYAFSGAGWLPRMPLLRTALVLIAAIYLIRAIAFVPALAINGQTITPFSLWSSAIVLVYGLCYALGTVMRWQALAPETIETVI